MKIHLSQRLDRLISSPIREVLAVAGRPGMISLAGGLPSPESFPELDIGTIPVACLQYGPTSGDDDLREEIAARLVRDGLPVSADQVIVLSGSQQGIDLVAKLFVDAGTPVAVESPTYLAALQVFRFFGAQFEPFDPSSARSAWLRSPPALAYTIPTFQNPTAHCYSSAQRQELAAACEAAGVPLYEDDPYRELAYESCDRMPVCSLLKGVPWIYQGSFSKTLSPGLRLGFIAASRELVPALERLKQAADLHTNRVSQRLVLQELGNPRFAPRLQSVIDLYRRKRDAFALSLEREFRDIADWQVPAGGLFFWLRLKTQIDTRTLLPAALERGVAFMPGEFFYPEGVGVESTLRLNFTHAGEGEAREGLSRLAKLLYERKT